MIKVTNTIKKYANHFEVYIGNEFICSLDNTFLYLTDRTKYNAILKNKVTQYNTITPKNDKQLYIHRLVAGTKYTIVAGHGMHVNHINGNKNDNRLENLEYITGKENQNKKRNPLTTDAKKYMREYKRKTMGYTNFHKSVTQKDLNGNVIKVFKTMIEASRFNGICVAGIRNACMNIANVRINGASNQYKNFIWERK